MEISVGVPTLSLKNWTRKSVMLNEIEVGVKEDDGEKQGRIHGNPVAGGLAGAVMRKLLAI